MTVTETANRTEKAVRIASYIDNTPTAKNGGVDAAAVRRFSEVTWAQLAEMDSLATGRTCRSLSSETRAAVVAIYTARETLPADPFKGLGQ